MSVYRLKLNVCMKIEMIHYDVALPYVGSQNVVTVVKELFCVFLLLGFEDVTKGPPVGVVVSEW